MNLICITTNDDDYMDGYASNEDVYMQFIVFKDKDIQITKEIPKGEYRDYEHYAAVVGKFDPYAFFFRIGIEIDPENFDGVKAAYKKYVDKHGEPL